MSVTYGFYNSKNKDRRYDAIQMSSIFDGIIRDGIFQHVGTAMMVKESTGMMVNVGIGRAWFNHTWTLNDALLPLTVSQSEVILNRIDAVVLEVDARESVRANAIKIVKGTPATSPVKPTMVKTNERWQYPLAYIRVKSGVTSIRQADITNTVGTSECPFVTAPLEKMSIDDLIAQWKDQWDVFYGSQTEDMEQTNDFWKAQWRTWFEAQTSEIQEVYLNWEHQWEEFYNTHSSEIVNTAEYWKDMWQKWFYDYVNNSSRELAYWKKLVTDDFTEYSDFWKAQWRTWFEAQTSEIQEVYLNWEHQWEEFFDAQTSEMQEANSNWKSLWDSWFYSYVNASTKEFTDWKASIDRDFRDWWDAIKELIDGEDISAFANKLVELDGRVGELEEFQNELTTSHSIHDGIIDSSDETILDGTSEPLEGKRVVFVVENSADLCEELEDVKRRLSAIEQAFDGLINEFTVYQILTDGGTWLYTNKPDADRTDQILDSQGGIIRGKTIFVTK